MPNFSDIGTCFDDFYNQYSDGEYYDDWDDSDEESFVKTLKWRKMNI